MHLFQLGAGIDHGRISWICRHQGQRVGVVIYPLEGSFAINAHCGDLTVFNLRLDADIHHIFIVDAGIYHAVAVAGQGKITADIFRHVHHFFNVLLCCDGFPAGNGSDQRHFFHFGHRFKARRDFWLIFERNGLISVQHGYHIVKIHVDRLCHRFDRFKRWNNGFVVYRVYVSFQNGYICLAQPGHFGKLIHTVAMFSAVLFYQIAQNHVEPPSFLVMVSSTSYILLDKKSSLLSNLLDIYCLVC